MKKVISLFYLLGFVLLLNAQKYDNVWLWGISPNYQDSTDRLWGNAQGTFDHDSIIVNAKFRNMAFQDEMSSLSNDDGELIIYSNGFQIRDTTGSLILGGDSINSGGLEWDTYYQSNYGSSDARGMIMLNKPGHPQTILIFHQSSGDSTNYSDSKIMYTEVLLDSGNVRKVVRKNQLISQSHPAYRNLAACKHGNGRDWWLLFTRGNSNCVVKILITEDTIMEYEVQCIGDTIRSDAGNKATFSLDGSKFSNSDAIKNGTNVFDFDRCTGLLSNYQHIEPIAEYNGAQLVDYIFSTDFSPDNRFIYLLRGFMIYQFDLLSPLFPNVVDTIAIRDTFVDTIQATSANPFGFWSSMYGPDGRLYIGPAAWQRFLCTINNPNGKGNLCDFRMRNIILPKVWYFTFPNFPNYRLGRLIGSACDTLYSDIKPIYTQTPWLKVFPNPATDEVQFDYNWIEWEKCSDVRLTICDVRGATIMQQEVPKYSTKQNFSVKQLAAGVYTVQLYGNGLSGNKISIANCKLVKQ